MIYTSHFRPDKNQSDRAMEALQTLAKLSPTERGKLQAALQSLNNNTYINRGVTQKPQPIPVNHPVSSSISPMLAALSLQSPSPSPSPAPQSPFMQPSTTSTFDLGHLQAHFQQNHRSHNDHMSHTSGPSRPDSAISLQSVNLKTNLTMYRGECAIEYTCAIQLLKHIFR